MKLRHSFRIGDYVRVVATTKTVYDEKPSKSGTPETPGAFGWPVTRKKLHRSPVNPAIEGWIVGAVRRFEGRVFSCGSEGDPEPGRLARENSKLLWKIARSMTNVPVEAADTDVELLAQAGSAVSPALAERVPPCPMRLGTPWDPAYWSPEDQRKEMAKWPRDAKGHWLKKTKGGKGGPAS